MKHKVNWSVRAQKKQIEILNQIKKRWDKETAKSVKNMIKEKVALLEQNKELCPPSNKIGVRKCVISKQTALVYRVKGNTVQIITLIYNKSKHSY